MLLISHMVMILALFCFLLAAFDIKTPRLNLDSLGLFLWLLSILVRG